MATCNDVAKIAGVSRQTVSRVVNNDKGVSNETKDKVLKVIKDLNYYPNVAARSLKSTKSRCIGLIIPDANNDFYIKIANLLQQKFYNMNYSLLVLFSDDDKITEEKCLETLIQNRIELLLFSPSTINNNFLNLLHNYNIKAIQLFRYIYKDLSSIMIDDEYGTYIGTKELINKGYKKILLVEEKHSFETPRYNGYKKALLEANIEVKDEMFIKLNKDGKEISKLIDAIKEYKPSAIIGVAKTIEMMVLRALIQMNKKYNDDVAILFYDDNEIAEFFEITSITHDFNKICDTIVELSLNYLQKNEGIKRVSLNPILLIRKL